MPEPSHNNEVHTSPRWVVRLVVYIMLVISALGAFVFDDRLWQAARRGSLPVWAPLVPAITFTAFVIVYTIDRWLLVRRRGYPAVRAFFQVAAAAAFLTLLWPEQATELQRTTRAAKQPLDSTGRLLSYKDPEVRAAACELVGLRLQTDAAERVLELAQKDPSNSVRLACQQALVRLEAAGHRPQ